MAQAFAARHRTNQHRWRSSPYLYWKLASRTFCDQHYSEVWCKQCIVPIPWCSEAETLPNCNKCHPLLWHTIREDNTDNSDYETDWDTPDPEDIQRIPDLPQEIPNMDERPTEDPLPPTPDMGEFVADNSNIGVSDGLESPTTPTETQAPEQLCNNTLQCFCDNCQEQFHEFTHEPQEAIHHNAKRRRTPTDATQGGHPIPPGKRSKQQDTPSIPDREPLRPRRLSFSNAINDQPTPREHGDPRHMGSPSPLQNRGTNDTSSTDSGKPEPIQKETSRGGSTQHPGGNTRSELERTNGRRIQDENRPPTPNTTPGPSSRQDEVDTRGLEESENDKQTPFWTFVIRTKPIPKTKGRRPIFTCTDHGDHWHITFQCLQNNVSRKRETITTFLQLGSEATAEASASTIIIRSIKKWIFYLVRYGLNRLQNFGPMPPVFERILNYLRGNRTTDSVDGIAPPCISEDDPCPYMNLKRETRSTKQLYKDRDYDYMQNLITEKKAKTFQDLMQSLSQEEFRTLYITLGSSYADKLRNVIYFNKLHERMTDNRKPIWIQIREKNKQPANTENITWLENMLAKNNIDIPYFLAWFQIIGDQLLNKVNTLVIEGPTGTGKSLTLQSLLKNLNVATVTRTGDASQFHFQNLLYKNMAILEEPRISQATVDEYKLLLEGAHFEINVKNRDMQLLTRKPIFISTNRDIGYWVPPTDSDALKSRTKTFHLLHEIKGFSDRPADQYQLDQPPSTITPADWLHLYDKFKQEIDRHVNVSTIKQNDIYNYIYPFL